MATMSTRISLKLVEKFLQLDALPVKVAFEGENVAELLFEKKAKWHKACHLNFSQSKLTRALEKLIEIVNILLVLIPLKRSQSVREVSKMTKCAFFAYKLILHLCCMIRLDHELRKTAEELQDTSIMSKIAGGDLVVIDAKYHNRVVFPPIKKEIGEY